MEKKEEEKRTRGTVNFLLSNIFLKTRAQKSTTPHFCFLFVNLIRWTLGSLRRNSRPLPKFELLRIRLFFMSILKSSGWENSRGFYSVHSATFCLFFSTVSFTQGWVCVASKRNTSMTFLPAFRHADIQNTARRLQTAVRLRQYNTQCWTTWLETMSNICFPLKLHLSAFLWRKATVVRHTCREPERERKKEMVEEIQQRKKRERVEEREEEEHRGKRNRLTAPLSSISGFVDNN